MRVSFRKRCENINLKNSLRAVTFFCQHIFSCRWVLTYLHISHISLSFSQTNSLSQSHTHTCKHTLTLYIGLSCSHIWLHTPSHTYSNVPLHQISQMCETILFPSTCLSFSSFSSLSLHTYSACYSHCLFYAWSVYLPLFCTVFPSLYFFTHSLNLSFLFSPFHFRHCVVYHHPKIPFFQPPTLPFLYSQHIEQITFYKYSLVWLQFTLQPKCF